LVEAVLDRSLPAAALPRLVSCRDVPGTKVAKLGALKTLLGEVTYVGDTGNDIIQASKAGVHGIAVSYGYSSVADLVAVGTGTILARPADLADFCRAHAAATQG
jgi:phosphoglycolate phosphatase-like HAD superfamily hydrolase